MKRAFDLGSVKSMQTQLQVVTADMIKKMSLQKVAEFFTGRVLLVRKDKEGGLGVLSPTGIECYPRDKAGAWESNAYPSYYSPLIPGGPGRNSTSHTYAENALMYKRNRWAAEGDGLPRIRSALSKEKFSPGALMINDVRGHIVLGLPQHGAMNGEQTLVLSPEIKVFEQDAIEKLMKQTAYDGDLEKGELVFVYVNKGVKKGEPERLSCLLGRGRTLKKKDHMASYLKGHSTESVKNSVGKSVYSVYFYLSVSIYTL